MRGERLVEDTQKLHREPHRGFVLNDEESKRETLFITESPFFEVLLRRGGRQQNGLAQSLWFLAFFPDILLCTSCSALQMGSPLAG